MPVNGSTVIPSFRYNDAHAAIAWFERVLGFARQAVYENDNGTVAHAQLTLGKGMIMLGSPSDQNPFPGHFVQPADIGGRSTAVTYLVVDSCTPLYERAKAEGAEITGELKTMDYGGQAFSLRDPEGYLWSVGEYDPWATDASQEA